MIIMLMVSITIIKIIYKYNDTGNNNNNSENWCNDDNHVSIHCTINNNHNKNDDNEGGDNNDYDEGGDDDADDDEGNYWILAFITNTTNHYSRKIFSLDSMINKYKLFMDTLLQNRMH